MDNLKPSADLQMTSSPVGGKLNSALAQKKKGRERGAGGSDGGPGDFPEEDDRGDGGDEHCR